MKLSREITLRVATLPSNNPQLLSFRHFDLNGDFKDDVNLFVRGLNLQQMRKSKGDCKID
ncbi:hypothetical protein OUZ56_012615 [Daphnia magna]|uniref:Uncharacterized protein n=1 Tax=Daphnia magna TaxID=35525 RepID=A0ABQ9Z3K5_9CRUS|nr:hypothetical protein OUZ56_012615 [Daphnia magna]